MDWNREVEDRIVVWEAHRGGGGGFEMPESCLAGFEYGWMLVRGRRRMSTGPRTVCL